MPDQGVPEKDIVQDRQLFEVIGAAELKEFLFFESLLILDAEEGRSPFGELGRGEHGLEGVVVLRRNGVELMVVTAGALQGMGEEGLANAIAHVVKEALSGDLRHLHPRQFPWAHAQETRRDDHLRIIRLDLVARDLLADELIVALIRVEGTHHVIPITPGVPSLVVIGEAGRIGVTGHVQPVLGHALSVVRGREQPVDQGGEGLGLGPRVFDEGRYFFRLRRQAKQVERRAADQGDTVGSRGDREARRQLRHDERVDGVALVRGKRRLLDGLISPHVLGLVFSVGPFGRQATGSLHDRAVFRRPLGFVRLSDSLDA